MITTLLLALACSTEPAAPPPPKTDAPAAPAAPAAPELPANVTKAAKIANAIAKDPAKADAILAENGTTRADFETMLFEIAADSTLSAQYAQARSMN